MVYAKAWDIKGTRLNPLSRLIFQLFLFICHIFSLMFFCWRGNEVDGTIFPHPLYIWYFPRVSSLTSLKDLIHLLKKHRQWSWIWLDAYSKNRVKMSKSKTIYIKKGSQTLSQIKFVRKVKLRRMRNQNQTNWNKTWKMFGRIC